MRLLAYFEIPASVVQAQLGHADPRITLEIYTHVASGAQREALERLERLLFFPSYSQIAAEPASKMVNGMAGCKGLNVIQEGNNGCDRDRTDDLYRVKVALIPTELRTRGRIHR